MQISVVAIDVRSCHNVGSILRTCEALGVKRFMACGYTPYPELNEDTRPPNIIRKQSKAIQKTALGAEQKIEILHYENARLCIDSLKENNYEVIALEQATKSINLADFNPSKNKLAILLGNELDGLSNEVLKMCDAITEIPMLGDKESLNVAVAAGICIYKFSIANK